MQVAQPEKTHNVWADHLRLERFYGLHPADMRRAGLNGYELGGDSGVHYRFIVGLMDGGELDW